MDRFDCTVLIAVLTTDVEMFHIQLSWHSICHIYLISNIMVKCFSYFELFRQDSQKLLNASNKF